MVIVALSTAREFDLIELPNLLSSAALKEKCPWGSIQVNIKRTDPSCKIVEEYFRRGLFACLSWVHTEQELYEKASYVILAGRRSKLTDKLNHIRSSFPKVKKFKSYSIG